VWLALIEKGERRELPLGAGRSVWVHVARGSAEVNGHALSEGDGAAVTGTNAVALAGTGAAEVLVFDLA